MLKKLTISFVILSAILFSASESDAAIRKVAKQYNFISVYGGFSKPHGQYDGLTWEKFFGFRDIDGDEIYDNTFHFGVNYGALVKGHFMYSLGFRYTKHAVKDTVYLARDVFDPADGFYYDYFNDYTSLDQTIGQFDFEVDINYMPLDLDNSRFSPYFGIGGKMGITNTRFNGLFYDATDDIYYEFENENDFTFNFNLNFGAEFVLWQSTGGKPGFVTLASINSYDLLSNDDKPRYLNIGGALKYYFRN